MSGMNPLVVPNIEGYAQPLQRLWKFLSDRASSGRALGSAPMGSRPMGYGFRQAPSRDMSLGAANDMLFTLDADAANAHTRRLEGVPARSKAPAARGKRLSGKAKSKPAAKKKVAPVSQPKRGPVPVRTDAPISPDFDPIGDISREASALAARGPIRDPAGAGESPMDFADTGMDPSMALRDPLDSTYNPYDTLDTGAAGPLGDLDVEDPEVQAVLESLGATDIINEIRARRMSRP